MECAIFKGHNVPEAQGLCVVIDVLRAFTTAAFAFASGAKEIIFVSTIEEAFSRHRRDSDLLLMGEREGNPIEGFHFGNSPGQMEKASLVERRMVQRTSSGTQGVVGCQHASHILVASFVVADATLRRILEISPSHVSLIVTGRTNGDEDLALAEYLQCKLMGMPTSLEHALHRVRASPAAQRMRDGVIGGYREGEGEYDINLALKMNHFSFAMEVFKENDELVGRTVKV